LGLLIYYEKNSHFILASDKGYTALWEGVSTCKKYSMPKQHQKNITARVRTFHSEIELLPMLQKTYTA